MSAYAGNCFFFYFYTPLAQYFIIRRQQSRMFFVHAAAAVANLATMSWLVERFGLWGSVAGSGITHATIACGGAFLLRRDNPSSSLAHWWPVIRIGAGAAAALTLCAGAATLAARSAGAVLFVLSAAPEFAEIFLRIRNKLRPSAKSVPL
jgi:O-antigen/teichoic acid export membrane protein